MTSKDDDEYLPVVEGAKAVGKASLKGVKVLYGSFFPSRESELRRRRKRIGSVMAEIELVKEEKKLNVLLKELKEAEEE